MNYKKYKIKADDNFQASGFPKVVNELDVINKFVADLPTAYKKEILISFFKKQSLQDEWITANPELTSLVTSGIFATGHLESLFDSCQQNKQFQQQYEGYIFENIS